MLQVCIVALWLVHDAPPPCHRKHNPMQKKHLILAVLVTAVWGLNFPVTKLGLAAISPLLDVWYPEKEINPVA